MSKKNEVCGLFEERLMNIIPDAEIANRVSDALAIVLKDYSVERLKTEIIPYEDKNERILKRYIACMRLDGKSEKTINQYVPTIRKLQAAAGKEFTKIGTYDIRFYLASAKERGVSNVTLQNYLHGISSFFAWMEKEEFIVKNPCKAIGTIKTKKEIKMPFSDTDIDKLRTACKTKRDRAMVEFLLTTGIRVNELVNVCVSDVDFQHLSVHIREGKGGKERIVYFNEVTAMHLREYIKTKGVVFGYLFPSQRGNGMLQTNAIRDLMKRIGERAGVDNVHPHRFRRTFATNLYKRGMEIREIQKLMGHSNIETTLRYIYTDDASLATSYKQHAM